MNVVNRGPIDAWRPWFAWIPVRLRNGRWTWLRRVEWRPHERVEYGTGHVDVEVEYRLPYED